MRLGKKKRKHPVAICSIQIPQADAARCIHGDLFDSLTTRVREHGPECLSPCLLDVSDRGALSPFLLPQQRVFPRAMYFSMLGLVQRLCKGCSLGCWVGAGPWCPCWSTAWWLQCCRQRRSPSVPKAPSYDILKGGEIMNHTRSHQNRQQAWKLPSYAPGFCIKTSLFFWKKILSFRDVRRTRRSSLVDHKGFNLSALFPGLRILASASCSTGV